MRKSDARASLEPRDGRSTDSSKRWRFYVMETGTYARPATRTRSYTKKSVRCAPRTWYETRPKLRCHFLTDSFCFAHTQVRSRWNASIPTRARRRALEPDFKAPSAPTICSQPLCRSSGTAPEIVEGIPLNFERVHAKAARRERIDHSDESRMSCGVPESIVSKSTRLEWHCH